MQLTENFTLDELTATSCGLDNRPEKEEVKKLLLLSTYILQPMRDKLGRIKVTSGYRSPEVNKRAGGSTESQHLYGEAADCVPLDVSINTAFRWITDESGIRFGQAILEQKGGKEWIHISLPRPEKPNQQAFVLRQ